MQQYYCDFCNDKTYGGEYIRITNFDGDVRKYDLCEICHKKMINYIRNKYNPILEIRG